MNYSYKILSAFGVDIELHIFFLLFIAILALFSPFTFLLLLLIFFYVTLHELSHCYVAKRNNIKVKKIILLPIGGMAVMDVTSIKPVTEIKMAIAGPLFNLVITYLCLLIANICHIPLQDWLVQFFSTGQVANANPFQLFIFFSFYANWLLGAFNLLVPAFPLDGGRLFRAILALKLDYMKATRIAKNVSLIIAVFLFTLGIFVFDLWISIIAFFIAFAAIGEYEATVLHKMLGSVKTSGLVSKQFLEVKPDEPVDRIAEKMVDKIHPYAILKTKIDIRMIDVEHISQIPEAKRKTLLAQDIARTIVPVTATTKLDNVVRMMNEQVISTIPVLSRNRLVGVIHKSDIEKIVQIKKAVAKP